VSNLQAALDYYDMGFHPLPCVPKDKRPLVPWKQYQQSPPTREQIINWWTDKPDANVALIMGRGMFAVDLDGGREANDLLMGRGVYLPQDAPISETGSGYHVFLSGQVADAVGLLSTQGHKPQVDIRGVGYVIAPPSIHPNGKTYRWLKPLHKDVPSAPASLLKLIAHPEVAHEPAREVDWDNACTRLAGFFIGKGIDSDTTRIILENSFARNCVPPFDSRLVGKCVDSIVRRHGVTGESDRQVDAEPLNDVLIRFQKYLDNGDERRVRSHSAGLDTYLSGGFGAGELIYLGARPGTGKTAFALQLAISAAVDNIPTLFISREMVNIALVRRVLAQQGKIPASNLRPGKLTEFDLRSLQIIIKKISNYPLYFSDKAVSFDEILKLISSPKWEAPIGFLIVDYLQLVRASREIRDRRLQVESVSQGLKNIAMQFNIPVLCLSSLSRPADKTKETRPSLSSLRESGELEHDADVVMLLHRPGLSDETECVIAKNRDGMDGVAKFIFDRRYISFQHMD
jgi:archaellum biogenesis ATPase FlaH